jgi:hypothetical protein
MIFVQSAILNFCAKNLQIEFFGHFEFLRKKIFFVKNEQLTKLKQSRRNFKK